MDTFHHVEYWLDCADYYSIVQSKVLTYAKEYADAVRKAISVSSVFLYGSHARGTATPESDIDIAVVVNEIRGDYLDTLAGLWRISRKISLDIEPVLLVAGGNSSGFLDIVRQTGIAV